MKSFSLLSARPWSQYISPVLSKIKIKETKRCLSLERKFVCLFFSSCCKKSWQMFWAKQVYFLLLMLVIITPNSKIVFLCLQKVASLKGSLWRPNHRLWDHKLQDLLLAVIFMARGLLFKEIKANPDEGIFPKLRSWLRLVKFVWFWLITLFWISCLIIYIF